MPNNPIVLVMYASLLMQMDRDGQAAHTTLQLAQKANTSVFERMQIYMAQHLEKNIKRGKSCSLGKVARSELEHVCLNQVSRQGTDSVLRAINR